jgi:hypothetical protein
MSDQWRENSLHSPIRAIGHEWMVGYYFRETNRHDTVPITAHCD